jgi:hypothetical protein
VDDADPRFTWIYQQEVVPRAVIGPIPEQSIVRIELRWTELRWTEDQGEAT